MRLRAVLLILVAAAVLVGLAASSLYLLSDPERVRSTAEASLSQALDREVRLRGSVGLRFLPMPQAVIAEPEVLAVDTGTRLVDADRIDMMLSPLALLTGRDPITSLTMVRPVLADPVPVAGLLRLVHGVGVGEIRVVDATISLQLVPDAPFLMLTGLSLEGSRNEAGETRVDARARDGTEGGSPPVAFAGSFRRADASGGVPAEIRLSLGPEGSDIRAEWTGLIGLERWFGRASVQAERPLPNWLGRASELAPAGPWQADARLDMTAERLAVQEFTVTAGSAAASGTLDLDRAARSGTARLELHDAVLDGFAGSPELPQGHAVALHLVGRDLRAAGLAVPTLDLTGRLEPDGGIAIDEASATVAANGTLRLREGRFTGGRQSSLSGSISVDLPSARPILPLIMNPPAWLPVDKPGALLAEGQLTWTPASLTLNDADLRLDQLAYRGRFARTGGRFELSGEVDRLDLDEWWRGPAELSSIMALLPDGSLALDIGRLSWGDAWIPDVSIEALASGGRLTIAEVSAGASEDLRLTMAGAVEPRGAAMDMVLDLDARRPARIGSLLGMDLPWLSRLDEVEMTASLRGPHDRLDVIVEVDSGDRHVRAAGILGSGTQANATSLRLRTDAPDLATLLGDLALLPLAPSALRGPVESSIDLRRAADGHWLAEGDLRAGPLQASCRLDLRPSSDRPRLAGQIALAPVAEEALSATYDVLSTTLAFAPGSPLRWPGSWPIDRLRFAWLFGSELDLMVRRKGVKQRAGLLNVQMADGRLLLDRIDLDLPSGGRLQGRASLDGTGEVPVLDLSLALDGVDAGATGELLGIGRAPDAPLAAELDLSGAGASVAAIVSGLGGELRLAAGPGTIPPPAGSVEPPFAFTGIQGALEVDRGVGRTTAPGLALDLPDGTRHYLDAVLDLPVWFLDVTRQPEADRPGWHLLGPPGRLQFREISPTGPASVPGAPDGRTPPPSEAPAPAPIP